MGQASRIARRSRPPGSASGTAPARIVLRETRESLRRRQAKAVAMILDLRRFVETERPQWKALEATLTWLEMNPGGRLSLEEATRFHALYQQAADDLSRVASFAAEGELQSYLAGLVRRAY